MCEQEREFYYYVCGYYHPSALIMDLDWKIAFKMPTEEFEEITIDRNNIEPDLVDIDSFWEKPELQVISKAFTCSNLKSLNIEEWRQVLKKILKMMTAGKWLKGDY